MKKLVVAVLIFAVVGLTSCSEYTCATYAKAPVKKDNVRI
jgi:hypothetical protein